MGKQVRLVRPTVAEAMVGKQKTLDFSKKWWYIIISLSECVLEPSIGVPAERCFLFQRPLIVTIVITGIVPTDQFQFFAIPDHHTVALS